MNHFYDSGARRTRCCEHRGEDAMHISSNRRVSCPDCRRLLTAAELSDQWHPVDPAEQIVASTSYMQRRYGGGSLDVEKFWRELQDPRSSPAGRAHLIAEAMRVVYGLEIDESRLLPASERSATACQHEWLSRHSLDDEWRTCRLCGAWTGVPR